MIERPIQSLDLVRGELPSLEPIVGMWRELWPGKRFAMHPQTCIALMQHYGILANIPKPELIELRDDLPPMHLHPLPADPVHPFVRLDLVES
jgi:hypothetical protein